MNASSDRLLAGTWFGWTVVGSDPNSYGGGGQSGGRVVVVVLTTVVVVVVGAVVVVVSAVWPEHPARTNAIPVIIPLRISGEPRLEPLSLGDEFGAAP